MLLKWAPGSQHRVYPRTFRALTRSVRTGCSNVITHNPLSLNSRSRSSHRARISCPSADVSPFSIVVVCWLIIIYDQVLVIVLIIVVITDRYMRRFTGALYDEVGMHACADIWALNMLGIMPSWRVHSDSKSHLPLFFRFFFSNPLRTSFPSKNPHQLSITGYNRPWMYLLLSWLFRVTGKNRTKHILSCLLLG